MNRLIRMVINMVMRTGIDKGVDLYAKRRTDAPDATSEDAKRAAQQASETKKRARQSMRMLRRLGRF